MTVIEIYTLLRDACGMQVSTDTRTIAPGSMFFALRGETFDGNQYATESLQKGARYAVVDDPAVAVSDQYILVFNVLLILQQLAAHHRQQFGIPVLGIGGSNGKTTTRELCVAVLRTKYQVHSNAGNLNNHIGVPLTILALRPSAEIAVIEIGSNHSGEHAVLLDIVQPTHVLLTNNGKDHIGEYGSYENAVCENLELYRYALVHGCTVFVPQFLSDLVSASDTIAQRVLYPALDSAGGLQVSFRDSAGAVHQTQFFGGHMLENMASAYAIGREFAVPEFESIRAITELAPYKLRGEVVSKQNQIFVLDCYNANPSSMVSALQSFADTAPHPRGVILGDMRELGQYSADEHRAITDLLATLDMDQVILIGDDFCAYNTLATAHTFPDTTAARAWFATQDCAGYTWLLKGSRGVGVERVLDN